MANEADAASLQGDYDLRLAVLETRIDTILPTLATKADLGEVTAAIGAAIGDMRAAIGDTKVAIADTKSAIITWLTASLLGVVAIFLSALFFVAGRIAPVGMPSASFPVSATPALAPTPPPAIDPLR